MLKMVDHLRNEFKDLEMKAESNSIHSKLQGVWSLR